jgi:hypothetical protein
VRLRKRTNGAAPWRPLWALVSWKRFELLLVTLSLVVRRGISPIIKSTASPISRRRATVLVSGNAKAAKITARAKLTFDQPRCSRCIRLSAETRRLTTNELQTQGRTLMIQMVTLRWSGLGKESTELVSRLSLIRPKRKRETKGQNYTKIFAVVR